jgi:hypothetical protein
MSKWVCRGRKVVETVGRWVVWTRKEGTWKGELVGSGGRRGGRTSDIASHTVPICRAQIAWQGREGKGRVVVILALRFLRTTQHVFFTLCCTLQAARSQHQLLPCNCSVGTGQLDQLDQLSAKSAADSWIVLVQPWKHALHRMLRFLSVPC